jgi:hypothetical protein
LRPIGDAGQGTGWRSGRTSPDFRRLLVSGRDESLVVDLVFERAPQIHTEKPVIGSVRVDPIEEIVDINPSTLRTRMREHGLTRPTARPGAQT